MFNAVAFCKILIAFICIYMEPMALGSPVASPVQSSGSPATSAYLPSFLLGDTTTVNKFC